MITYEVELADLAVANPDDKENDAVPSTLDVDERTRRVRVFDNEDEALVYALAIETTRADDRWLAFVRILRCTREEVRSLDRRNGTP